MSKTIESKREIPCPTCQKKTLWSAENPDRPFCSARCRLIDLGEWASESYSIPQQSSEEDELFSEMLNSEDQLRH